MEEGTHPRRIAGEDPVGEGVDLEEADGIQDIGVVNAYVIGWYGSVRDPFGGREGDQGYLLSAEYRMPLFLMPISPKGELVGFGFHLFTDAGDAWYDGADASRSLRSWGAGLHINLDTWQLRFEAARTEVTEPGSRYVDFLVPGLLAFILMITSVITTALARLSVSIWCSTASGSEGSMTTAVAPRDQSASMPMMKLLE